MSIVDFVYERDAQDVLKIIQDDWSWLFMSNCPHYDFQYVLQHMIPNEALRDRVGVGMLKMKVLREENQVRGFVTFYKEDSTLGRIRVISVSSDFREKGYGRKLTLAAVSDLFALGCETIYLFTHKKNEKVADYESVGFQEVAMPQDTILYFEENGISREEYAQYGCYSVNKKTFKSSLSDDKNE